jgi:SNF2 family DNA or RNA helicase
MCGNNFNEKKSLKAKVVKTNAVNVVTSSLLQHQQNGVKQMIHLESKYNGGFLFDQSGMGKTLMLISFILETKKPNNLIICPSHLISHWVNEIKKHTDISDTDLSIYSGNAKKFKKNVLINLISYNLIGKVKKCPRYFERLILDEGQHLKNLKTKLFKRIEKIVVENRWLVTSFPFSNKNNFNTEFVSYMKMVFPQKEKEKEFSKEMNIAEKRNIIQRYIIRRKKIDLPDQIFTEMKKNVIQNF